MPPPKFTFKRSEPAAGTAPKGDFDEVVKFQCSVNRRETAGGRPMLNARGKEQCSKCQALRGASFGTPRPAGRPPCTRSTCLYTPYCWQHLAIVCHLKVARSQALDRLGFRGLGLYAWWPQAPDGVVFGPRRPGRRRRRAAAAYAHTLESYLPAFPLYGGEAVGLRGFAERYNYAAVRPTPPYGAFRVFDAACVRGAGAYANDARGVPGLQNNARLASRARFIPTRNIRHGQEILVSYGGAYWATKRHRRGGVYVSSGSENTADVRVAANRALGVQRYKNVGRAQREGAAGPDDGAIPGRPSWLRHAVLAHADA